ncbi:hypothetical protein [Ensifer sp. M14]|uniref:hypothetical protein n=1 Tax=Ensifer sp. M14 TaxID=2203782 RepID=UPI0011C0261C|nr:hypothetical protein [Ensifer sp. M14]
MTTLFFAAWFGVLALLKAFVLIGYNIGFAGLSLGWSAHLSPPRRTDPRKHPPREVASRSIRPDSCRGPHYRIRPCGVRGAPDGEGLRVGALSLLEGIGLTPTPFLPNLLHEEELGFDVGFQDRGRVVVLQFQLGHELRRFHCKTPSAVVSQGADKP